MQLESLNDVPLRQQLAMPGLPISERRQIAMIKEMMTKEAAASKTTQRQGKSFRIVPQSCMAE